MRKYNMTATIAKALGTAPAALVLAIAWLAVEVVERLNCYRRARRESAQLLGLGERDLRDIGISRVDAIREAGRSAGSACRGPSLRDIDLGRPQP
jgi:uncharacterized protein YjiS (DUF1127 family)